jgi:hypothetical protein
MLHFVKQTSAIEVKLESEMQRWIMPEKPVAARALPDKRSNEANAEYARIAAGHVLLT